MDRQGSLERVVEVFLPFRAVIITVRLILKIFKQ